MKYLKLNKMSNSSSSTGISFFGLLGIVFIIFKLTHIIDWSWWLILLPLYGSFINWYNCIFNNYVDCRG